MSGRLREALVWLTLLALPLSTAAMEVGVGLLLAWSLADGRARRFLQAPWAAAALLVAGVGVLGAAASGELRAGLAVGWSLAPLVALAGLPTAGEAARVRVGLAGAAAAAVLALAQRALGQAGVGTTSHHLTLAYALVPPFAVAVARRGWGWAALLGAGVLASGSDAAPLSLAAAALVALGLRPALGWAVGAGATLAGLATWSVGGELRQRAVVWTGGLLVGAGRAGAGGYRAASAPRYDALEPGFWFPNHAHDSFVQVGATLGGAGWVAWSVWIVAVWQAAAPGAAAGVVGVLVGALTQDTLGDLEVARAAFAWVAILGTAGHTRGQGSA